VQFVLQALKLLFIMIPLLMEHLLGLYRILFQGPALGLRCLYPVASRLHVRLEGLELLGRKSLLLAQILALRNFHALAKTFVLLREFGHFLGKFI
jgi:hypothetical protein